MDQYEITQESEWNRDALGSMAMAAFDDLVLDLIPGTRPCCVCGKATGRIEFFKMIDSGEYKHLQLSEVLISGTHPECWDAMLSDDEE